MTDANKNDTEKFTPVSEIFHKMSLRDHDKFTKVQDIIDEFSDNAILITLIFFSLPIAVPLPYPPGVTSIFAIPLIIFSFKLIWGNSRITLPKKIGEYEFSNQKLIMILKKLIPLIKFCESYMKPRMSFPQYNITKKILGYICLIASLSVFIPIPLTNAIPAFSISILALGFINQDGIILIIGFVIFVLGILIALFAVTGSLLLLMFTIKSVFKFFRAN